MKTLLMDILNRGAIIKNYIMILAILQNILNFNINKQQKNLPTLKKN